MIEIYKNKFITVETKGYRDRFITAKTIYNIEYKLSTMSFIAKVSFDNREKAVGFMYNALSFPINEANHELDTRPESTYISGDTTIGTTKEICLSLNDVKSINAYLSLLPKDEDMDQYKTELSKHLEQHPLTDDIKQIVDWQIAKCDLANFLKYGHKNGHQAALQAGVEVPNPDKSAADAIRDLIRRSLYYCKPTINELFIAPQV